jgi:hypothetical protein
MSYNGAPVVEPLLTNHIISYPVQGAIADIVSPRVDSDERGRYETYDKSAFKVPDIKPRRGMTPAGSFTLSSSDEQYETLNYPLKMELDEKFIREQQKLNRNPRITRSEQIKAAMTRAREMRVATLFSSSAASSIILAAYNSVSNPTKVFFDDTTNSHPFSLMEACVARFVLQCGVYPSHVVLNPFIEYALANHPDRDTKSNQSQDRVRDGRLGDLLLNMQIVRAFMPYDSAGPGRTASDAFIWGNNVYLIYRPDDVSQESPTASKTFDAGRQVRGAQGIAISEYPGNAGEPGVYIEGNEDVDEQVTCANAIFVIKDVLLNATGPSLD